MDALATPFVQGRLRSENLAVLVQSSCAVSGRPLTLEIDSNLQHRVQEPGARPIIFAPLQVVQPGAANIIDGF